MKSYSKATRRYWREKIKERGFSPALDPSEIAAASDIVVGGVARASRAKPASAAMKQIYDIVERSTRNHDQLDRLDCKAGCNFCCHQYVSATALEIFYLARFIEASPPRRAQTESVARVADILKDSPNAAIEQHMTRCGLLTDKCSVYAARPVSCRGYNSEDVEQCKKWLANRNIGVPINLQHLNFANKAKVALWAALKFCGFPKKSYELNEALWTALTTPNAEQKWFRGQDVFDGVNFDEFDEPKAAALVDKIVSLLKQAGVETAS